MKTKIFNFRDLCTIRRSFSAVVFMTALLLPDNEDVQTDNLHYVVRS